MIKQLLCIVEREGEGGGIDNDSRKWIGKMELGMESESEHRKYYCVFYTWHFVFVENQLRCKINIGEQQRWMGGCSKSWHGRVGGKDHYWLSQGASFRLMEESHQNTPENEIQMQKQKHSINFSWLLKVSVSGMEECH